MTSEEERVLDSLHLQQWDARRTGDHAAAADLCDVEGDFWESQGRTDLAEWCREDARTDRASVAS